MIVSTVRKAGSLSNNPGVTGGATASPIISGPITSGIILASTGSAGPGSISIPIAHSSGPVQTDPTINSGAASSGSNKTLMFILAALLALFVIHEV